MRLLVSGDDGCLHLATSSDGLRLVLFQGHPEYDTISLLKEYKREVILYQQGKNSHYPPFPQDYFDNYSQAILNEYRYRTEQALASGVTRPLSGAAVNP